MGAPPAVRNTCETVDSLTAPSPSAAARAAWCLAGAYVVWSDSTRRSQPSADAETGTRASAAAAPAALSWTRCLSVQRTAREARATGERQQEQPGHTLGQRGGGGARCPHGAERSDAHCRWTQAYTRSTPAAITARSHDRSPGPRPAAKSPQLRIVPCRHTRARAPPCCVCNACARLHPFESTRGTGGPGASKLRKPLGRPARHPLVRQVRRVRRVRHNPFRSNPIRINRIPFESIESYPAAASSVRPPSPPGPPSATPRTATAC